MSVIITTIASIFVFSVVILIHEFGHYWTARRCGIRVNEFSIGMGPALVCWVKNGIQYSLRLLPIGGYVSMEGENGEEEEEEEEPSGPPRGLFRLPGQSGPDQLAMEVPPGRPFGEVSVPRRMAVVAAGAVMNFVLGFLILLILVSSQPYITSRQIHDFTEGASSQASGLQVDDVILSVNGHRCFVAGDILYELSRTENYTADFVVKRDGQKVSVPGVTFDTQTQEDGSVTMVLGFRVYAIEKTPVTVIKEAFSQTLYYGHLVISSLVDLARGRVSVNDLSGPVGIVSAINTAVSYGWKDLFSLMALITVNLGIFNLLPFPALDGGRLVLLVAEGITRRPVPKKAESFINMAGMVLLMALMVFVTFQDVLRLT